MRYKRQFENVKPLPAINANTIWVEKHICDLKQDDTFKLDQSGYEYTVDLIKHNLVRYREVHTLRKTAHSRYLPYMSTQKVFIKQ